jgi:hypothetical protein
MKKYFLCFLCLATAGCGLDESTSRSDTPVSREAAAKGIDFPFPNSATNIYYFVHSGGMQEFQMFVRFTVQTGEETNAVDAIQAAHNKRMGAYDSFSGVPLANMMSWNLSQTPWWTVNSITNGFSRGSTSGQPFYLWADLSQHTIYVHASD